MGVKNLFTYVKENLSFELTDLVQEAQKSSGMEILIDFYGFQMFLFKLITKQIVYKYKNNFLLFPGGEFDIIHKAFYDFQKAFENVGIKLVWIVDGPRIANKDSLDKNIEKQLKRDLEQVEKCNEVLNCCSSKSPPFKVYFKEPLCTLNLIADALKKAGGEVIQLLKRGSKDFIVYEFHRRKSFAILTNDTDLLLFENCRIIFMQIMKFNYKHDHLLPFMDQIRSGNLFKSPRNFLCPTITNRMILDLFRFARFDQLIALSILKGNRYTNILAEKLHVHLKITNSLITPVSISQVVEFMKTHVITMENIRNHPILISFMDEMPEFRDLIERSNDFYSLKRINENIQSIIYYPNNYTNRLTEYLSYKLSISKLPKRLYAIHFGRDRDKATLECPDDSCASIYTILREISQLIYPYILIESEHEIILRQSRESRNIFIPVCHSPLKINDIQYSEDGILEDDPGLKLFNEIWSHLEPNGSLEYFTQFGIERGFICYILRYFYQITKNKNLNLSTKEFKALFVTVFYNYSILQKIIFKTKWNRESFLYLNICPTKKCLTINSWFLCIFNLAKYFCGGALSLEDKFPEIQNLFQGSIFYAFYEYLMNDFNTRSDYFGSSRQDFKQLLNIILEKYYVEYQTITK